MEHKELLKVPWDWQIGKAMVPAWVAGAGRWGWHWEGGKCTGSDAQETGQLSPLAS